MLLAAALLMCIVPQTALAENPLAADVSALPRIDILGALGPLYFNEGTPEQELAFDVDFETLLVALRPIRLEMLKKFLVLDGPAFTDYLVEFFLAWMGPISKDWDGNDLVPGITRTTSQYTGAKNGELDENNCASFSYDWRNDPMDVADELAATIDEILEKTGADKVNLFSNSGAAMMLTAYLQKYGCGKVASVVYNIPLHNGTSVMGKMATRQVSMDSEALGKTRTFDQFLMPDLQQTLAPILRGMYEVGLLDVISLLVNTVGRTYIDRFYDEAVIPTLFSLPAMWGYVPLEYYEEAKLSMFKGDPMYDDFIRRIDRYHYEVQANADEILQKAAAETKLALRVGYGMPLLPLVKDSVTQSDAFVDTVLASGGAVCAPLYETLPKDYTQQIDCGHNHISPDRAIDASTCALPEHTWFAYNHPHARQTEYSGWYEWFLRAPDATVHGSAEYPQFVHMVETGVYRPLEPPKVTFQSILMTALLWVLKGWRWVAMLPWFWLQG